MIMTSLQVLYRLKEKVQVSDRQLKAPPPDLHLTPTVHLDSAQRLKGTKVGQGPHIYCLKSRIHNPCSNSPPPPPGFRKHGPS